MNPKLILVLLSASVGAYITYKFFPQEKIIVQKEIETKTDVVTVTRTIKEPNGKVITEYITQNKTEYKEISKPVPEQKKKYKVGLIGGYDFNKKTPTYGLVAGKYLTKNTNIGVYLKNDVEVGLLIDYSW